MTTLNASNIPVAAPRRPWSERVNFRLIAFFVIVAAPFAYILYTFLSPAVTYRDGYAMVDLKALGNFPFDQERGTVNDVPKQFRELDGKKVVLQGFMFGETASRTGTKFQFVYDVQKCCFGGPPQVQERVFAQVPPGTGIPIYSPYEFAEVTGTLHVRVIRDKDTGAVSSVYDLDVERARKL